MPQDLATRERPVTERPAGPPSGPTSAYAEAGVDTQAADDALRGVLRQLAKTKRKPGLNYGYFASVIEFAGTGLALCTDGVGSKALVAQMMNKYDTIGIDCVAMNVNDLICVGATPISMLDYIAVEAPDPTILEAIAEGLRVGADQAGVSVAGGEIAQLGSMIAGTGDHTGFDLVGMAVGSVDLDKIVIGEHIADGDVVVGLRSNGVHSNGLTLARKALLGSGAFSVDDPVPGSNRSVGEELLAPTHIHVAEALEVLDKVAGVKALIHITGDGFLNLNRVKAKVGYVLDSLPTPPPIFPLIQKHGGVADAEMFSVFNMGVGFCFVVAPGDADQVIAIAESHGREAPIVGRATAQNPGTVAIPSHGLIGEGKVFREVR